MKTNICIVCGKRFFGRPNKLMCSFECKQERARRRAIGWTLKKQPQWIDVYQDADRLTKIAMLAAALSEYNIERTSYGYLSTIWDTAKYKTYEHQVFKRKRLEDANYNAKTENSTKGKDRTESEDRAEDI